MKRINYGFTLIELMFVVAIIGILAAVGVPQYQNYVARSQVTEGFSLAGGIKTALAEYHNINSVFPTGPTGAHIAIGIEPAGNITGKYVTGVAVSNDGLGTITATFGSNSQHDGKILRLTPTATDGAVLFTCSTDIEESYIPSDCEDLAAKKAAEEAKAKKEAAAKKAAEEAAAKKAAEEAAAKKAAEEAAAKKAAEEAKAKKEAAEEAEADCCLERGWKLGESVMERVRRYKASGCGGMTGGYVPGGGSESCRIAINRIKDKIGRGCWRKREAWFMRATGSKVRHAADFHEAMKGRECEWE
jgi:type IV pilus assembly protein PilA